MYISARAKFPLDITGRSRINGGHSHPPLPVALPTITVQGIGLVIGGPADTGRGILTATGADTLTVLKGRHSFKIGGEFRPSSSNNFSTNNGTFTFASAAAFVAGTANAFTQTLGDTSTSDLLRSWVCLSRTVTKSDRI